MATCNPTGLRCRAASTANEAPWPTMGRPQLPAVLKPSLLPCRRPSLLRSRRAVKFVPLAASDTSEGAVGVATLEPELASEDVEDPKASGAPKTLVEIWAHLAETYGEGRALYEPHRRPEPVSYSYRELQSGIEVFASGLQQLGLARGERVALFSENSSRWLISDQGIMSAGGVDAVRGATNSVEELTYIALDSGASGLIVQDTESLDRILEGITTPFEETGKIAASGFKFVITMWGEPSEKAKAALSCPTLSYAEVTAKGEANIDSFTPANVQPEDLATLVYTSGTTGHPKGAQLTHANLMYQVDNLEHFMPMTPGQRLLSLLPPWHIYARSVEYTMVSAGVEIVFSGIRTFKEDLGRYEPDFFVCVPLVLDTLYTRVMDTIRKGSAAKKAIVETLLSISGAYVRARRRAQGVHLPDGAAPPSPFAALLARVVAALLAPLHALAGAIAYGKIKQVLAVQNCVVSGGGSLAPRLDDFFEIIGLPVVNGWGLTETSPVLACRSNRPGLNVRGTIGRETPGTKIRVVDPESLADVLDGTPGLLLAQGPGVMGGYWQNEEATKKAFPLEGWFDTGDLGMRVPASPAHNLGGQLAITGRAKDTIVLSSGENVEPQPIEDAITASAVIQHALVLGQDHRSLGALVWLNADAVDELKKINPDADVEKMVKAEVTALNRGRREYEPFHRINAVRIVEEPLGLENGTLTRTMKPRRPYIAEYYAEDWEGLLAQLR